MVRGMVVGADKYPVDVYVPYNNTLRPAIEVGRKPLESMRPDTRAMMEPIKEDAMVNGVKSC